MKRRRRRAAKKIIKFPYFSNSPTDDDDDDSRSSSTNNKFSDIQQTMEAELIRLWGISLDNKLYENEPQTRCQGISTSVCGLRRRRIAADDQIDWAESSHVKNLPKDFLYPQKLRIIAISPTRSWVEIRDFPQSKLINKQRKRQSSERASETWWQRNDSNRIWISGWGCTLSIAGEFEGVECACRECDAVPRRPRPLSNFQFSMQNV